MAEHKQEPDNIDEDNIHPKDEARIKGHYFDNYYVEQLMIEYVKGGCTDRKLRDEIMSHATELIRQVIRTHNLHEIYPGRDPASFGDLEQVAWCVSPDTLVFTENGIQKINEIIYDSYNMIYGKEGLDKTKAFIKHAEKPVRKIITKFGYNIAAGLDHPILCLDEKSQKWKQCGDLEIGDYIAIQYGQECFGNNNTIEFEPKTTGGTTYMWSPPNEFNEELAYIVGLIIAEGSIEKNRVVIYNTEVWDIIKNNNLGLRIRNEGNGRIVINSTRFVEFIKWLDINNCCQNKKLPYRMLTCSRSIIVSMLQGMFDGDGHSNSINGQVGYTSTSKDLIDMLRILLLNFGIISKLSTSNRKTTNTPDKKDGFRISKVQTCYQLVLSSNDSRKYYDNIGFRIIRKMNNSEKLTSKPFRYLPKYILTNLRETIKINNITNYKVKKMTGVDVRLCLKGSTITESTLRKLKPIIDETHGVYLENRLTELDSIIWLPIISIENMKSPTIDIETLNGTFTGNGIITHNCQIESALYKFDISKNRTKLFNMWCVAPDTILLTSGGVITIGDIENNVCSVIGIDGLNKINAFIRKSTQETLKLKTFLGYELECTPMHQVMVQGREWIKASELEIGDLVPIQFNDNYFVGCDDISDINLESRGEWQRPDFISEELAYIIGLFIAEGSYSYDKLVIYSAEDEVISRLINNTLGLNFIYEPQYQRVFLCCKRFIELLTKIGFDEKTKAYSKSIPQRLTRLSKNIMSSMLMGMFDGGGHSSQHDGCIGYTSTSKMLINQLRVILLNYGLLTKLSIDNQFTDNKTKSKRITYQINCSTKFSSKFYDIIGFGIQRKQDKKKYLKSDRQMIFGVIPYLQALYHKYGPGKYGYDCMRHIIRNKSGMCTIDVAQKIDSWDNYSSDNDYIAGKEIINDYLNDNQKIIWLPIIDIEKSANEVCEISVDSDSHSYLANGIITHNSQISKTVILAYIKKETRDRKNYNSYKGHLTSKGIKPDYKFARFIEEAKEICNNNEDYIEIIEALETLHQTDDRPYDGLISKLVKISGLPRVRISNFLKYLRYRQKDFTDSPANDDLRFVEKKAYDNGRRKIYNVDPDDDD